MQKDTVQKRSAGGIVHNNGKFLVLDALDHGQIILPKGTMERGETPEETAVREILEETGYHTKIKAPLQIVKKKRTSRTYGSLPRKLSSA